MPLIDWKLSDDDTRVATVAALMLEGKPYAEIAVACRVKKNTLSSWIYSRRDVLPRPGRVVHSKKFRTGQNRIRSKPRPAPIVSQEIEDPPVSVAPILERALVDAPGILTPSEALVPVPTREPRQRKKAPAEGVHLLQHERWQCAWPIWQHKETRPAVEELMFCGAPIAEEGCPYCQEHKERAAAKLMPAALRVGTDPAVKSSNRGFRRTAVRA